MIAAPLQSKQNFKDWNDIDFFFSLSICNFHVAAILVEPRALPLCLSAIPSIRRYLSVTYKISNKCWGEPTYFIKPRGMSSK